MSSWSVAGFLRDACSEQSVAVEEGSDESRIARVAVALLRGDVAVLHTESRAVLAAASGVATTESARQLANPVEALAMGYRSQLSVPLWRDGRRVGALAVLGRDERRFTEADIALLRALAGRIDLDLCSVH